MTAMAERFSTVWEETVSREHPLGDYPRPQFMRPSWLCLNGPWDYDLCPRGKQPEKYRQTILVPFSPESALSDAQRGPGREECAWYRRSFTLPEGFLKDRLLLHFGAVDQRCEVFVNGRSAGSHVGGYTPFTLDITELVSPLGRNVLSVAVEDDGAEGDCVYGKQAEEPGTIWYTGQSGIWQTVWMESVPQAHFTDIRITPLPGRQVELQLPDPREGDAWAVFAGGKRVLSGVFDPAGRAVFTLEDGILWTPERPFLYDLLLRRGRDVVKSYFALRTFTAEKGQFLLNGEPIFLTGLLDQGYWPESLYTPPTDEAMIYDIETARSLGFNVLRKHVKLEPLRWYYHCDRLGMLVWQDVPNGGGPYGFLQTVLLPFLGLRLSDRDPRRFGRGYDKGRERFALELEDMARTLYNSPSVVLWTLFNEGWGQFDTQRLTARLKEWTARPVDSASGWHDQGCGDIQSVHRYFGKQKLKGGSRVQAITECGGYSLPLPGHRPGGKVTGYHKLRDRSELMGAIQTLYEDQLLPLKDRGLRACIYTQLSDVETELNGLLTWDRKELKVDAGRMRALNEALKAQNRRNP